LRNGTPPTPESVIANDPSLSQLQKILLTTDGTVTQLLELLTGEKIRVEKLEHSMVSDAPPMLVSNGETVLSRRILLCGAVRPYLYAHSWLVPGRMPSDMQEQMRSTDTPIGQLWKSARLETFREIVDFRRERDDNVATLFGIDAPVLSRTYLIHAGGSPMGLIAEKFPATLFGGQP
jgi:chorismate-pyruvate lyase